MFGKLEKFLNRNEYKKEYLENGQDIKELSGTHAAILATNGFEQSELFEPKKALEEAGCIVHVISMRPGKIRAWKKDHWGRYIDVDMTVREAAPMEFDFLVLPGGVINPDKLREDRETVSFVSSFVEKKRPIAAICHGVQTLIETGFVRGKKLTSYPSLKTDLINAGASWVNEEVVVDDKLITSRKPSDIPAFNEAMIREFSYGKIHSTMPNTEAYVVTM